MDKDHGSLPISTVFFYFSKMVVLDVVDVLLFYVHGKYLRSCRDGQLT